jgi:hypothetical protein
MTRAHMDEMNAQTINLGGELWQCVQLRFAPTPIVFPLPVLNERLDLRQLQALRSICDRLAVRPPGRYDASA